MVGGDFQDLTVENLAIRGLNAHQFAEAGSKNPLQKEQRAADGPHRAILVLSQAHWLSP